MGIPDWVLSRETVYGPLTMTTPSLEARGMLQTFGVVAEVLSVPQCSVEPCVDDSSSPESLERSVNVLDTGLLASAFQCRIATVCLQVGRKQPAVMRRALILPNLQS